MTRTIVTRVIAALVILAGSTLIGAVTYAGAAFFLSILIYLVLEGIRPWMRIDIPVRFSDIGWFNSRFAHLRTALLPAIFGILIGASTFSVAGSWVASFWAAIGGQLLATSVIIVRTVMQSSKENMS